MGLNEHVKLALYGFLNCFTVEFWELWDYRIDDASVKES